MNDDVRAVLAGERRAAVECGDALSVLRELPDGCVQTCVTSPPYFQLRDYKCDGQIGLEKTPELYIAKLVGVFAEARRVMRDDATLWVNIGDSYAGGGGGNYSTGTRNNSGQNVTNVRNRNEWLDAANVKQKDLLGIPWMLAFALRADGWYLRQEIIWAKRNCMPESVTDRRTKSHEQLFLLAKSPRYYFDAEAIKETSIDPESHRGMSERSPETIAEYDAGYDGHRTRCGIKERTGCAYPTRNRRSVWTLSSESFQGSHFAVMPTKLVAPCVLAGTSERGCCPSCGKGWVRVTDTDRRNLRQEKRGNARGDNLLPGRSTTTGLQRIHNTNGQTSGSTSRTTGWRQGCDCPEHEPRPCLVLDPFAGAGTVPMVANQLGRRGIGIELNSDYADMARRRIATPDADFSAAVASGAGLFDGVAGDS